MKRSKVPGEPIVPSESMVPRWSHREAIKRAIDPASQFKEFDPLGMTPNIKAIKPQPYPDKAACFYFKPAKRFAVVFKGKIGTFEQWGNELGMDAVKLRYRVRECNMSIQEAFTTESLNTTDHSKPGARAYKYCPCSACVLKRLIELEDSLTAVKMPNPEDQGKVFKRNDASYWILYQRKLVDLNTLEMLTGVSYKTLYARIFVYGWPLKRALKGNFS